MAKQVMVRAWEIAKTAVKKFGGKVREYFAMSLSIAWKEVKAVTEFNEKEIKLIGMRGHNVYVAVPATMGATVVDCNFVVLKGDVHKEFMVYAVPTDHIDGTFDVVINKVHHKFKINVAKKIAYYNGTR